GEEGQGELGDAHARAVDGCQAREEEVPPRQVVRRQRGPGARHAAAGDAPVVAPIEPGDRQLEAHEGRYGEPLPSAEHAEEGREERLFRALPAEAATDVDRVDLPASGERPGQAPAVEA